MAEGKLSEAEKAFVVQALACFDSPSAVVDAVRKEFGKTINRQSIEAYDPGKKAGANLAAKWRELFTATREAFISDTAEIGVSHRSVRLRTLQRMIERAERSGNMVLVSQLLEQAAKEMGDAFTNRREVTGKGGKDLPAQQVTVFALPDNDRG